MHRCKDCRIVLDDDVRFCPKCGVDLAPGTPVCGPGESNVESLLASANLHRLRSEWEAAISDATDALRLDPRNPDVASLLGDIYVQREMLDEALVWYQMALELNPNSTPDRERLEKLSKEIASRRREEGTGSFKAFEKQTRVWTYALGAVFLLLVVLAFAIPVFRPKPRATEVPTPTASGRPRMPSRASSPMPPGHSEPIVRPESDSSRTPATGGASSLRTPAESDVRTGLTAAQSITDAGITIDDVIADPRSGVVTVSFGVPVKGLISREQITRAAAAVARTVFALRQDAKFVTARCVVQANGSKPIIAFVGDTARQSIEALGTNATDEQLAAAFSRPWWHPDIRQ